MTPSQEAKEYAAKHGFGLALHKSKRVRVEHDNQWEEFSGYPAALNYMRRIVGARPVEQIAPGLVRLKEGGVLVREGSEDVTLPPGAIVAVDIETQSREAFEAVDSRVMEAFAKAKNSINALGSGLLAISEIPCAAVGNKRWQKIKRAQRKERRLARCVCYFMSNRPLWRVWVDHQLEASCESRKYAIAFVRKYFAGECGVAVQYV